MRVQLETRDLNLELTLPELCLTHSFGMPIIHSTTNNLCRLKLHCLRSRRLVYSSDDSGRSPVDIIRRLRALVLRWHLLVIEVRLNVVRLQSLLTHLCAHVCILGLVIFVRQTWSHFRVSGKRGLVVLALLDHL